MEIELHGDYLVFAEELAKDLQTDIKTATEWLLGYIGVAENVDTWTDRLTPIKELRHATR